MSPGSLLGNEEMEEANGKALGMMESGDADCMRGEGVAAVRQSQFFR
jgi:hypothetical protein